MNTGLHGAQASQRGAFWNESATYNDGKLDAECARRIRLNDGQTAARKFFRAVRDFAPNASVERHRRRRSRRRLDASMLVVLDQFRIIVRTEQRIHFVRIGELDHEQPAIAERVLVDGFRFVGEPFVHLDHFTADRRIDIRRGLHRLDHRATSAGFDLVTHLGQLDIDEVAQQTLGVIGNADTRAPVFLDPHPFVRLLEFEVTGNLAHDTCPSLVGRPMILPTSADPEKDGESNCRNCAGAWIPSQGWPSLTNGYFTVRSGSSRPRMSARRSSRAPAGTRANAMALPSVGEKMPERISPSPLPVTTRWPCRSTPLSSITTPISSRGTPSDFCFPSAVRPIKSRPSSSDTVQARPASHGVVSSSMSWPYRF